MFQFASLLGIAARNNLTAVIPYNPEMERIFKISTPSTKNLQNTLGMYLTVTQFYGRCCYYDILTETLDPRYNYLLYGYFQSWKYFKNVNDIVRQEFQFREEILNEAKKFHRDVSNKFQCHENNSCTFVGIHIRRGDISDYDVYKKAGYTTPSEQYFKTAMNFFKRKHKNKVVFIVCSDSSKGWQKKLTSSDVVFSHAKDQGVDLAILSLCQHMIISTGTYGWWAAFLTGGTTIYYRDWPKAGSWLYDQVFKEDYFVRGWIPMK
ncbi:galactoside 2-alpha-L-fucosyltransferase 3 [Lingula anatina]|uniref:L-Fucosyltransferase n=1 Tax=Lingula anatina TaxID=7574 RepID=A0A1S3K8E0_LINAN|nr:galactoside 2-alpha-L-fucosyltransferase 3 [Lingula anatina]|eukprot:XP_013418709.2 galactoside 2-alpha-L-fucosyltransferase 3 [Lingula anatina]